MVGAQTAVKYIFSKKTSVAQKQFFTCPARQRSAISLVQMLYKKISCVSTVRMEVSKIAILPFCFPFLTIFVSCSNHSFFRFDEPYISYQIAPVNSEIIRLVRTNGNGLPSLQLFDGLGNLKRSVDIGQMAPMDIGDVVNHKIKIVYYASRSNLEFVEAWLQNNKINPTQIGHYKIEYSREFIGPYYSPREIAFDSFGLNQERWTLNLYNNKVMLDSFPVKDSYLYPDEIRHKIPSGGVWEQFGGEWVSYVQTDSLLIHKLLLKIATPLK